MIDPITAFATAQAAVAGIQKAIKLGKDINGLIKEFGAFFDAKDVVQKAANDLGKSGKSDTAQAMEIVMQAQQLKEAEEQLRHQLIYGGYPELWEQMLVQRQRIRQERAARERAEAKERARIKQLRADMAVGITLAMAVVAAVVGGVFVLVQVLSA